MFSQSENIKEARTAIIIRDQLIAFNEVQSSAAGRSTHTQTLLACDKTTVSSGVQAN